MATDNNYSYPFHYYDSWLNSHEAGALFTKLLQALNWQEEFIYMYGKKIKVPRLVIWIADANCYYSYSGIKHKPQPWPSELDAIRNRLNKEFNLKLNSVLANLYRNNLDYMGWHQDNEPELGKQPVIVSLNLGATRKFVLRHCSSKEKVVFHLNSGSLLIMQDDCQEQWEHCLPKTTVISGVRINLTFRTIINRQPVETG